MGVWDQEVGRRQVGMLEGKCVNGALGQTNTLLWTGRCGEEGKEDEICTAANGAISSLGGLAVALEKQDGSLLPS
jgi:hypothetical protein